MVRNFKPLQTAGYGQIQKGTHEMPVFWKGLYSFTIKNTYKLETDRILF